MKTGIYTVKFAHQRPETHCIIETPDEVFKGVSKCSTKDMFCKDTGRKIALKKALNESDIPKEHRAQIWEEYRNMTVVPRW